MSNSLDSFIAIDFETANPKRVSACAMGVVKVVLGEIVSEQSFLIHPIGDYSRINTQIHGIDAEQTKDAPDFKTVFEQIRQDFEEYPVVSYSTFDRQVINALFDYYQIKLRKDLVYIDVYDVARSVIQGLPNYELPTVAYHLQIPYETHHDAGADALQCARVLLKLSQMNTFDIGTIQTVDIGKQFVAFTEKIIADGNVNMETAYSLQKFLSMIADSGKVFKSVYELTCEVMEDGIIDEDESDLLIALLKYEVRKINDGGSAVGKINDAEIICCNTVCSDRTVDLEVPENFEPKYREDLAELKGDERWEYLKSTPLESLTSANVVITEKGVQVTRKQAEELVKRLGGNLKSSTSGDVDFCVVLGMPPDTCNTSKVERARYLQSIGSPIQILSESEFITLVKTTIEQGGCGV